MIEITLYLSLVVASLSFTLSETKLFLPLREWAKRRNALVGELLSCGYCFGHWVAVALVAIYRPKLFDARWLHDYFLTALVIVWFGAFQEVLVCWLMEKAGK